MAKPAKTEKQIDTSTEEKIKEAAKNVFTKKGYAATRVRDIAAEAGINLSLVNYYFRSKEKLFELVMAGNIDMLIVRITGILNDEQTSFRQKIEMVASHYIDLLLANPDLPLFLVNEVMTGNNNLREQIIKANILMRSHFGRQLMAIKATRGKPLDPLHVIMNLMGFILAPFLARPALISTGVLQEDQFSVLMKERKKLIPAWIEMIIKE